MTVDLKEVQFRWGAGEPIEGVAFLADDPVIIVNGPRRGTKTVARTLRKVDPEPEYELEGAEGERLLLPQSALVSPVPGDISECVAWIQKWYSSRCDGEWEHDRGVSIETLDNPGWLVKINLQGTNLEGVEFPEVRDLEPRRRWLACKITEQQFQGAGGPHMLGEILAVFVHWAQGSERSG